MARNSGIGLGSLLLYAGIGYGIYYVAKHGMPKSIGQIIGIEGPPAHSPTRPTNEADCVASGGQWLKDVGPDVLRFGGTPAGCYGGKWGPMPL